MATNDPLGTVQRMFAAFRAGDLDGILETVHSDSRWIYVGANPKPTKTELVGHANVRRFFEAIIRRLELKAFETIEFVVQGDTVVVFGSESGALRKTGAAFRNEWVQKYMRAGQPHNADGRVQHSGGPSELSAADDDALSRFRAVGRYRREIPFHFEILARAGAARYVVALQWVNSIMLGLHIAVIWGGDNLDEQQANSSGGEPYRWT